MGYHLVIKTHALVPVEVDSRSTSGTLDCTFPPKPGFPQTLRVVLCYMLADLWELVSHL